MRLNKLDLVPVGRGMPKCYRDVQLECMLAWVEDMPLPMLMREIKHANRRVNACVYDVECETDRIER